MKLLKLSEWLNSLIDSKTKANLKSARLRMITLPRPDLLVRRFHRRLFLSEVESAGGPAKLLEFLQGYQRVSSPLLAPPIDRMLCFRICKRCIVCLPAASGRKSALVCCRPCLSAHVYVSAGVKGFLFVPKHGCPYVPPSLIQSIFGVAPPGLQLSPLLHAECRLCSQRIRRF